MRMQDQSAPRRRDSRAKSSVGDGTSDIASAALLTALEANETRRRSALIATIAIILGLLMLGFSTRSGPVWAPNFWGGTLIAAAVSYLFWRFANFCWRHRVLALLGPATAERIGEMQFTAMPRVISLGEIARGNRGKDAAPSWRCEGSYRATRFRLEEITSYINGVHHRLVVAIAVPEPFEGVLQLHPHRFGAIGFELQAEAHGLVRCPLGAPIDSAFAIWCTSPGLAGELLTPNVQDVMIFLAERHSDIAVNARFANGWFTLTLPIRKLAIGKVNLTTALPRLVDGAEALRWEMTLPSRLIDALIDRKFPERLR